MKMVSAAFTSAAETPARVNPTATLSSIQESFFSRTFNIDAVSEWLWGVAVIAVILTAIILVRAFLARRVRYNPFGTITEGRAIRTIMRAAFDQRRPFEVQFQTEAGQKRPTLRCAPEYLGKDSLTLEVSGLKSLSDKWINRPVVVFFRILLAKEFTYYTFSSHVSGIHMPRQGICHIPLPIPDSLENRQKRSFLRISPPREFLLGAAIWQGETLPSPGKMNEITAWPRPKLLLIPDRVEQFQVLDISAGGARISIAHSVARLLKLHFNAAEHLMIMLDLFDPEQNRRLRFWMECRVQNAWVEHSSRDLHIGIQFLSWARPRESADYEDTGGGIEWLRLSSSNEVEALGNWIMRRHLELFRENPFDEF